jgi:hypothetical protein
MMLPMYEKLCKPTNAGERKCIVVENEAIEKAKLPIKLEKEPTAKRVLVVSFFLVK